MSAAESPPFCVVCGSNRRTKKPSGEVCCADCGLVLLHPEPERPLRGFE